MADQNEIQLELLPLRKTGSSLQRYKEDDTICGGGGPDRVGIDCEETEAYRSTLLPLQQAPHAEAMNRRERVLPRVKKRLREESQRIRDKGRRWREQKTQQCRLNLKDCDSVAPLRSGQGFREMSLRQELMHRQRNQNKARRTDSEFDILELCQIKGPTKSRGRTAVESSGFDSSLLRNGNDVQTLIEKDGKKKSDMAVYFDKEDATYSTGDTIKGHVNITLTQDVRVKDLKLQIFGNGRVSWGEQRSYIKGSAPKVLLRNSEVFLDHSMTLMRLDGALVVRMADGRRGSSHLASSEATATATDESIYLPAGVHNYPFEFDLPHDLPGSFEGRWGQVRYGVKATLVRPWKFDIEREKDFTLRCLIDLNDEPELARPIGALGEFSPGLMCIRNGAVTVELRIGRRGYVPGESIQFYVEVENNSRRKLQDTSVSLVQHVTYRAGKKMRKTSANVASLRKGETLPYSTVVWNTESVLIPPTPGTSCKYYKGIQIKYAVSLLVKYSSWSDAFCLSVPIVLGTTGLRRQTINTYLSMLGYCQTPRGSPANGRRNSNGQVAPSATRPATRQSLTAPCITGNVRHSSISSLQSVSKPRRSSPICTAATTRPRRDTALTLSSSKDNGLDASQLNGAGSKSGARCRLSSQLKPKSKSLDSTDKEGEEEEREAEEGERARYGKRDEDDDVFTKTDDDVKRTGVK